MSDLAELERVMAKLKDLEAEGWAFLVAPPSSRPADEMTLETAVEIQRQLSGFLAKVNPRLRCVLHVGEPESDTPTVITSP